MLLRDPCESLRRRHGTFAEHATMYFYRGREFDDGKGVLKGSGKDTRFLTLRTPADASSTKVKHLLRAAFRLASGQAGDGVASTSRLSEVGRR